MSDLHLETQPDFVAQPAPGADVLVLAGDIGSYQQGSRLAGDDFGLSRFAPRGGPWKHVLFVPGNHEYDMLPFEDTHARLRTQCERLGIIWLERETVVIESVRFVGTTLWSDFDALARQATDALPEGKRLAGLLKQRDKAFRAANFYLRKNSTLRDGEHVLADGIRALGLDCQQWLREALQAPFDGPTVAVTHFAPSLRSADPRYGLTPGTAGFCNDLDDLLPHAVLWLHGHLHCPNDYVVSGTPDALGNRPWRCRVLANPLGYAQKDEQAGFAPQCCVSVPGTD